jgi:hypothetical protein
MRSDPVKLRQCLFNLLSNAAKFTENGEVALSVRREGGQVVFRVSDTGIGMTPEQRGRLFRRFAQADASTTRRFGGTGLGLALDPRLRRDAGGRDRGGERRRAGTTFTLTLPADARGAARPRSTVGARGGPRCSSSTTTPHMRDLLRASCDATGCRCGGARTARRASLAARARARGDPPRRDDAAHGRLGGAGRAQGRPAPAEIPSS